MNDLSRLAPMNDDTLIPWRQVRELIAQMEALHQREIESLVDRLAFAFGASETRTGADVGPDASDAVN